MSADLKAAVTAAMLELLKAASPLFLNAKMGFGEFEALTKLAYVLAAHEQALTRGESSEPNVSRISTVTGLSRPAVTALLAQAHDQMPPVKRGRYRAESVLEGWRTDPRFADKNTGTPAPLPLKRGRPNFRQLVSEYSGDATGGYAPILDELLNGRAVAMVGSDTVRMIRASCVNVGWTPESVACIDDVTRILRALIHNLEHPEAPHYVRAVRSYELDLRESTVLSELVEATDDFVESVGVTLDQARPKRPNRVRGPSQTLTLLVQIVREPADPKITAEKSGSRRRSTLRPKSRPKKMPGSGSSV